jgi:hypothetical protein
MKTQPNDAAFGHAHASAETGEFDYTEDGLTKREYFAAAALSGLLTGVRNGLHAAEVARLAVTHADALLEALNK